MLLQSTKYFTQFNTPFSSCFFFYVIWLHTLFNLLFILSVVFSHIFSMWHEGLYKQCYSNHILFDIITAWWYSFLHKNQISNNNNNNNKLSILYRDVSYLAYFYPKNENNKMQLKFWFWNCSWFFLSQNDIIAYVSLQVELYKPCLTSFFFISSKFCSS